MKFIFYIFLPPLIYFINKILKKYNILLNYSGEIHQKYTIKEAVPLSGGLIILIYFYLGSFSFSYFFNIYLFLLFCLGLSSDLKIIGSPKMRFFFQMIILFLFIYSLNLEIQNTRIIILDKLLSYKFFSICFVLFCMMILVNGTNFIDGVNTNVIGYYLIISLILFFKNFIIHLNITNDVWLYWILALFVLYIFNYLKYLFIGDSGAYLLGLIYGFILINLFNNNTNISPFFIILLIWYPCFETLFSIIRKLGLNKSPLKPDNKHLHQILFGYLRKIKKIKTPLANNLSGILISLFNALVLMVAVQDPSNTQFQILIILFNITVYIFIYLKLFNKFYRKN